MRAAPNGLAELLRLLPITNAARRDLRRRLAEPGRHYHGAGHVALLWRRHRQLGAGSFVTQARWDRLIACAIAFHDAVYDPRRTDNEARSAALWRRAAPRLHLAERRWVERTILATADHLAADPGLARCGPSRLAQAWMLDLDLTPLGERAAEFDMNTRRLRREFAHLPEVAWEAGRIGFLRQMAAAPRLFQTRQLLARFGDRARANLTHALSDG